MNNQDWMFNLHSWKEGTMGGPFCGLEEVYTLYLVDFLDLPAVDYNALAASDPQVKVLFN